MDVTLIGEQPIERLLQRGACDTVLARDDAARRGLAVADREQDQAFVPVEAVPQCLVCISRFFE